MGVGYFIIIIIIGVLSMQDAVILFAHIVDSGLEFFSEVVLDRLILPEFIKSVFKNSHTGCCYYFLCNEFQGFTTLTAKLFLLIANLDGSVTSLVHLKMRGRYFAKPNR